MQPSLKLGREMVKLPPVRWATRRRQAEREGRPASLGKGGEGQPASVCKHRASRAGHLECKPSPSALVGGHLHRGLLSSTFHLAPRDRSRQARDRFQALTMCRLCWTRYWTRGPRTHRTEGPLQGNMSTHACMGFSSSDCYSWVWERQTLQVWWTPIKIAAGYVDGIDKVFWKCIWKSKGSRIVQTIVKMNKVDELTLP